MDSDGAFKIARIEQLKGGLIAASGRAYRDLHIGDILEDRVLRLAEDEQPARFEIVRITTYGRTVRSLQQMLTGVLVLRGRDDRPPRAETLAVTGSRSDDEITSQAGCHGTGEPH